MTDAADSTAETVGRLALQAANTAITRAQLHAQDEDYYEHMQNMQDAVHEHFMGIIPLLRKIFRFLVVTTLLLFSSIITYGLFYIIVMPGHHTMAHLYFDYTCKGSSVASGVQEPVCEATEGGVIECDGTIVDDDTMKNKKCSPVATVDLFARQSPWQSFHPDVVPSPITKQHILKPRQHYLMDITLVLPESSLNIQSGMFGVFVELKSSNETLLASSARSIRLPHESAWIGLVRKGICLAPLLLGALTESKTVVVEPFRHYVESEEYPLRFVTVKLLSRGGNGAWHDGSPVEVIDGSVRIGKELNWLQGILREYFYSCFIMGTICIFAFQALSWTLVAKFLEIQREELRRHLEEFEQEGQDEHRAPWEEVPGEEDDEWDDLPPQQESDRPVTPEHQPENQHQEVEPVPTAAMSASQPQRGTQQDESPAETRADRVMRGETERFEVFTDHDDPDL